MVEHDFKWSASVLIVPLFAVLLIWTVFWFQLDFGLNFTDYGIYPRRLKGLIGIWFSPLLHGSLNHLYNNTIPLVVLLGATFYFYSTIAWRVLIWGVLLSGLLTWLIGRPSYHIGASGLIYVLVSFTFFKGIFSRYYRLVALSMAVVFLYGSMIWYIFPIEEGISWEGHLSGFLTGLLLAVFLKSTIPLEPKYPWQQEDYDEENDPFMKHFDSDGNFIEAPDKEPENVTITYHYKKSEGTSKASAKE